MKHGYLIPLAAIVGLIAGSWGPRADLAALNEMQETQGTRHEARGTRHGFGAIADFANVPSRASRSRRVTVSEPVEVPAETNAVEETETIVSNEIMQVETQRRVAPEDLRARIDEAAELWRTRSEIAKTQWKTKLALTEAGAAKFDETIDVMNDALRETMVAASEEIAKAGKLTPELGTKLIADMTATLGETYEAIGQAAPPEKRAEVSEMTMHDFIDPSVIEPLASVQNLLENNGGVEVE